MLQSICSFGELSLDELMNNSDGKIDVQVQKGENENTVGTIDAMNKTTNEYTSNRDKDYDKSNFHINKKIRYITLLDEPDLCKLNPYNHSDTKPNSLMSTSSIEYSVFTTREKEANNVAQHILDRRKSILKTARSILHLSNCIDGMRKVMLQEIHKKQSTQNYQKNDGSKPLTSEKFPMYNYDSLRANNK